MAALLHPIRGGIDRPADIHGFRSSATGGLTPPVATTLRPSGSLLVKEERKNATTFLETALVSFPGVQFGDRLQRRSELLQFARSELVGALIFEGTVGFDGIGKQA